MALGWLSAGGSALSMPLVLASCGGGGAGTSSGSGSSGSSTSSDTCPDTEIASETGGPYRFNRRFDLRDLVARLIVDVARSKPAKETVVRAHAEAPY